MTQIKSKEPINSKTNDEFEHPHEAKDQQKVTSVEETFTRRRLPDFVGAQTYSKMNGRLRQKKT